LDRRSIEAEKIVNIGIIGLGYVGTALEHVFKKNNSVHIVETFDINKPCSINSTAKLVNKSEIIFLCLPTPMKKDGSCDISIVQEVISEINNVTLLNKTNKKLVVIKSTISIGSTDNFSKEFKNIDIVFNPEFLREATFIDDFKNQNRILIGGLVPNSEKLEAFYAKIFPSVPIIKTSAKIAESVKYFTNSFLTVKVSFANEMKTLCDKLEVDYDEVVKAAILDKRLGNSHWDVPGPDGKNGFGGACLPKDLASLINQFSSNGVKSYILKASWDRNIDIDRREKDWEHLKGRAISEN
jgi:UDPglucose 6-dehydrogenase